MISPNLLRQFWVVVETTQISTLLQFDDSTLVQVLLRRFTAEQVIDDQTTHSLSHYIESRLPLIRDTAEGRLSLG